MATFWIMGQAVSSSTVCSFAGAELDDVLFYDRSFWFINCYGDILVCDVVHSGDVHSPLAVRSKMAYFIPVRHPPHQTPICSYLVESRGRLLRLVRYRRDFGCLTISFKIYDMVRIRGEEAHNDVYIWREIESLNGRVIIAGRGCSKAYEPAQQPDACEGVYFVDDHARYDTSARGRPVSVMDYPYVDNGVWKTSTGEIRTVIPASGSSTGACPVWFIPGDE